MMRDKLEFLQGFHKILKSRCSISIHFFTIQRKPIELHVESKKSPYMIHVSKIPVDRHKSRARFRRKSLAKRIHVPPPIPPHDIIQHRPIDDRIEIDVTESTSIYRLVDDILISKSSVVGQQCPDSRKIPDRLSLVAELRKVLEIPENIGDEILSFAFPVPDVNFKKCQKFGYLGIKVLKFLYTLRGLMKDEYWLPRYYARVRDEALYSLKIEEFGKLADNCPEASRLLSDEDFWYFGKDQEFDAKKFSRGLRALIGIAYFSQYSHSDSVMKITEKFNILTPKIDKDLLISKFKNWKFDYWINYPGEMQTKNLENAIGYSFQNKSILAVVSFNPSLGLLPLPHPDVYYWLDTLGESVLEILISEYLIEYQSYSDINGFCGIYYTRMKTVIANLACDLGLESIISHSLNYDIWQLIRKGSFSKDYVYRSKLAKKSAILVQAVTGAVLVDCDFEISKVRDVFYTKIKNSFEDMIKKNMEMEENETKAYIFNTDDPTPILTEK